MYVQPRRPKPYLALLGVVVYTVVLREKIDNFHLKLSVKVFIFPPSYWAW